MGIAFSLVCLITLMLYIFQDKICNYVLSEMGKEFREPIYFSTVDLTFWQSFPNLSINVHDVKIDDAFLKYKTHKKLLKAEEIKLVFNPLDLWRENYHVKRIALIKGEINVRTDSQGDVNYLILNEVETNKNTEYQIKISAVSTDNFKVNYLNQLTQQYYCTNLKEMNFSGDFDQEKFDLLAQGALQIHRIQSGEVALLKNKPVEMDLQIKVNTKMGTFVLPNSEIKIAGISFRAGGEYDTDSMKFEVSAHQLKLSDLANKLSLSAAENELQQYKGSGNVNFDLMVYGSTQTQAAPNIACDFKIMNGTLIEPVKKMRVSNVNFIGNYRSNGNPNEDKLTLKKMAFQTAAGKFSGNLFVQNFITPKIEGKAKGTVDLNVANRIFRNELIDRMEGTAKINADFSLVVNKNVDVKKINGDLSLFNVWFKSKHDHRTFENINGSFNLKGNTVDIAGATLKVNRSDINMNGSLGNIYNYMANRGDLNVNCNLTSQNINVEDLGKTTKQEKQESKGKSFVFPNNIHGQIDLNTKNIRYENHLFQNVAGPVYIEGRSLSFPSLTVRNAGADISGWMKIKESTPERIEIQTNLSSKNILFTPLFKEWNNFDQEVIDAHQISGRAEMEVSFYAPFNVIGGIDMNAIQVNAHMKVYNGHLKDVQSLDDIASSLRTNAGKLLIGKKNLDRFQSKLHDVAFSTLENTFQIRNGIISIPNMHISSSAMDMDLSGTHTFNNQIDYHIKFDFRDLLGEDRDSEFGTVIDDEAGLKIYLRMYGDLDNPTIEWDKSGKKQDLKEQWTQEKETVKSMLKTEFGIFKNDTSVLEYKPKAESKEVVKLNFKNDVPNKTDSKPNPESPKPKDNKLKNTLNQWKQQQNVSNVTVTVKKG